MVSDSLREGLVVIERMKNVGGNSTQLLGWKETPIRHRANMLRALPALVKLALDVSKEECYCADNVACKDLCPRCCAKAIWDNIDKESEGA